MEIMHIAFGSDEKRLTSLLSAVIRIDAMSLIIRPYLINSFDWIYLCIKLLDRQHLTTSSSTVYSPFYLRSNPIILDKVFVTHFYTLINTVRFVAAWRGESTELHGDPIEWEEKAEDGAVVLCRQKHTIYIYVYIYVRTLCATIGRIWTGLYSL